VEEYIYFNLPRFADRQLDMFDTSRRITVSVASSVQMIKVFKAFDIPCLDKKKKKDSINENIINKSKHPFVKIWLAYQEANHTVTTYGQSVYDKIVDNRIYTSFNPMVDTARLSTRKGEINFLNFPKGHETRDCFKANEGNVMVVCDYSGQETVIAADLSGDEAMTKSVVEGADLHCLLARVLYPELENLDDETIKKEHKAKREASKAPRFAMSYGGNAFTIHMNEGIPLQRAQEIEDGFKNLHKGLYEWGSRVLQASLKTGYIESADGWKLLLKDFKTYTDYKTQYEAITREEWVIYKIGKADALKQKEAKEKGEKYKLQFPESVKLYEEKREIVSKFFVKKSEYFRLALNNPVQTTGAHQIKRAACILFDWIVSNNLQWKVLICNSIHDKQFVVVKPC
jgi:DNA polymerase I-like protein with 3'-5' exonuclease and polymerase domains